MRNGTTRRGGSRRWFKALWVLLALVVVGCLAFPLLVSRYQRSAPQALAKSLIEYRDLHGRYPDSWEEAVRGSFLWDYVRDIQQDPDPRLAIYYSVWPDQQHCEFVLIDRPLPFWKKPRTRHAYWESLDPEVFHEQLWR